jgi:hypothetical protein
MAVLRLFATILLFAGSAIAAQPDGVDQADPGARELALVRRANAELAANQAARAIGDADAALAIDRTDAAAADVKARAQASIAGQGQQGLAEASAASLNGQVKHFNDDVASRNAAKEAAFQAERAQYDARVQAAAADYAKAQADYQAEIKAGDARRAAQLAAWRSAVSACRHGDTSKCAWARSTH